MNKNSNNFIIGASGLIGSCLFKKLSKSYSTFGTYTNNFRDNLIKLNLINKEEVRSFIKKINENDNVFIMSAMSNPNWISNNRKMSKLLNVDATKFVISSLIKKNIRIIFMSSVEVFDGVKGNYKEQDSSQFHI